MNELGMSLANSIQDDVRPVVMFSHDYADGNCTAWHAHSRIQFLYAVSGTMRASTKLGAWIVPVGYGLIIPASLPHQVEMFGQVTLRSAYILEDNIQSDKSDQCSVIQVSELLAATMKRFASRPLEYDEGDIAHHLAQIIRMEITATPMAPLALPFPTSTRLKRLSEAMFKAPSLAMSIDQWAEDLGMSRRTFTRTFRAETGMSFDVWRQRLRYHAAIKLIAQGYSMDGVANKVGYGSASALRAMMLRMDPMP